MLTSANFGTYKKQYDFSSSVQGMENLTVLTVDYEDFEIKPLMDSDRIISVFLDDNPTTEWKALCKTKNNYNLLLGGTFTITAKI
jgi:hypothetical protein